MVFSLGSSKQIPIEMEDEFGKLKMLAVSNAKASVYHLTRLFLVGLCCLFALLPAVLASTEAGGQAISHQNYRGVPFAIADFDGDQLPDLAVVQVDSYSSPNSKYSIRVQFSSGPGPAIGIEAPLGGLRIDSRDVNGDDRSDLIVSTALESQVVAILVNDGHGNFAIVKPDLFPDLGERQVYFLHDSGVQLDDGRTLLESRSTLGKVVAAVGCYDRVGSQFYSKAHRSEAILRPIHSKLGRSPPAVVFP
jgi:hypothetical protein